LNRISFPNIGLDLDVSRVAFTVGNIAIYWYGILITAAVLLCFFIAITRSKRAGLPSDMVFDTAFAGAIGGFVMARLYYVLFNLDSYTIVTAFTGIRDGGLAIYGGIIGGFVTAAVYAAVKRVKLAAFADLAASVFLIGQAIGRWGNFFNQEAYGAPTAGSLPWGMTGDRIAADPLVYLAGENALVHPCFLYESLWCVVGFFVISQVWRKRKYDGQVFLAYIGWYGFGRFFIESIRTDSLFIGEMKISQIVAAASVIVAVLLLVLFRKRTKLYKNTDESEYLLAHYDEILKLKQEKKSAKREYAKRARELRKLQQGE
jgi:phosphatidylglycerol:prolipoprotein diacylglycerol transferase